MSAHHDKNGPIEPVEALKLSIKMFEEKRLSNPELDEDFKNQLILMNEFLDYLSKQAASLGEPFLKLPVSNGEQTPSTQFHSKVGE